MSGLELVSIPDWRWPTMLLHSLFCVHFQTLLFQQLCMLTLNCCRLIFTCLFLCWPSPVCQSVAVTVRAHEGQFSCITPFFRHIIHELCRYNAHIYVCTLSCMCMHAYYIYVCMYIPSGTYITYNVTCIYLYARSLKRMRIYNIHTHT